MCKFSKHDYLFINFLVLFFFLGGLFYFNSKPVFADQNTYNTIKLPNGYVNALKKYYADKNISNSSELNKFKSATTENIFKHSKEDEDIVIGDRLTNEQQLELTQWTTELINPIRAQFNHPLFSITGGSLNFAKEVQTQYRADNWNKIDHDVSGIRRAAAKYGLNSDGQYYENAGFGFLKYTQYMNDQKVDNTKITIDNVKNSIYNSLLGMFFDDAHSAWGHAVSLSGEQVGIMIKNYDGSYTVPSNYYFGVDVDPKQDVIHLITFNELFIKDGSKIDTSTQYQKIRSVSDTIMQSTNKTNLLKVIRQAQAKNESNYTKESFDAMQKVLAQVVNGTYHNDSAPQKQVEEATSWLNAILNKLVVKQNVNKNELLKTIRIAQAKQSWQYSQKSFNAMQKVLAQVVNGTYHNQSANQAQVNDANVWLKAILNKLVKK